jgi:hypothetical protein
MKNPDNFLREREWGKRVCCLTTRAPVEGSLKAR